MSQKMWNVVLALVSAAALVLGVLSFTAAGEQAVPRGANVPISFTQGGKRLTVGKGATLLVESGGTLSATSGTLYVEGSALSGPVAFGSASSVVTGTTIAHGLGTTPTAVLLTAGQPVTTTPLVLATGVTSITVGFLNTHNPPAMTVYWLAGK